jgi:hypothetical protein
MTKCQKLTCSMGSFIPNAYYVVFGTRARVGVSCRPALGNVEASTDPFATAAREANSEGCGLRFANRAARGLFTFIDFLDTNVNDCFTRSSHEIRAYRNLLVKIVLMWVAVAHLHNIGITDTGGLSTS